MLCARESYSFICRRNLVRHSVTLTVKMAYSTTATPVIQAKPASNLTARIVSTSTTSTSVGSTLYSENEISE